MSDYTTLERCIIILGRLACWNEVTVEKLYALFERKVSRRTLQRDLIRLSSANITLFTKPGRGKGLIWTLDPKYLNFIPLHLGLDEFFAVELLRNASNLFAGTPIGRDLDQALEKIKQLVPPDVIASSEERGGGQPYFGVHRYGYIDYKEYGEILRIFLWSAVNRQECYVSYSKPEAKSPGNFKIQPYTLLHHKGAFYGIGFQPYHKTFIYLLIHRIKKLENTGKVFDRDASFNLTNFLKDAFGVWKDKPEMVKIWFSAEIAHTIQERIWHPSQKIQIQKDGSIILQMQVPVSYELVGWVLYWGNLAKALEPESLKTEVKENLKKTLNNY
jgi:proteasome accessory factor B